MNKVCTEIHWKKEAQNWKVNHIFCITKGQSVKWSRDTQWKKKPNVNNICLYWVHKNIFCPLMHNWLYKYCDGVLDKLLKATKWANDLTMCYISFSHTSRIFRLRHIAGEISFNLIMVQIPVLIFCVSVALVFGQPENQGENFFTILN